MKFLFFFASFNFNMSSKYSKQFKNGYNFNIQCHHVSTKTEATTNFFKPSFAALSKTSTKSAPYFWDKSAVSEHPFVRH